MLRAIKVLLVQSVPKEPKERCESKRVRRPLKMIVFRGAQGSVGRKGEPVRKCQEKKKNVHNLFLFRATKEVKDTSNNI